MAVKRYKDPAGLKPDHAHIVLDGEDDHRDDVFALLVAASPPGRIERLREHPELAERADKLAARFKELGGTADWRLMNDIAQAEFHALYLSAADKVIRDNARQSGTRKPRNPELQAWIDREAKRTPDATAAELWDRAPDWVTDQIGIDRFRKRLSAARKTLGMGRK